MKWLMITMIWTLSDGWASWKTSPPRPRFSVQRIPTLYSSATDNPTKTYRATIISLRSRIKPTLYSVFNELTNELFSNLSERINKSVPSNHISIITPIWNTFTLGYLLKQLYE